MVSREIWEKHALMSFTKTHKLHSSFGLAQFCTFLKNSLVHVFPKLHSKPYYYLYKSAKTRKHCFRHKNVFEFARKHFSFQERKFCFRNNIFRGGQTGNHLHDWKHNVSTTISFLACDGLFEEKIQLLLTKGKS